MRRTTGLSVEQYFTCVTGLTTYLPFDRADEPVFNARSVANATGEQGAVIGSGRAAAHDPTHQFE
jgi:hypothetical protein